MSQAVANQQPTADSAALGKKDSDTNPIPTGNDIAKSEIGGKISPSDNDKPSNSLPVNQIEKSSGNNIMSIEKVNVNGCNASLDKLTQPLPPPTNAHDGQRNSIAKVASSNSSSTNPMPSTKKENKKDHSDRGTKEKADNSSSVSAPKHSDQVFVATTKTLSSPTPPSGKNDTMAAAPYTPKEKPDIIKDMDDKKQSGSMISSQDQPSNAGGESITPTSPSKKKSKKKRKKKKRKDDIPDDAQHNPSESQEQNQNANATVPQETNDRKMNEHVSENIIKKGSTETSSTGTAAASTSKKDAPLSPSKSTKTKTDVASSPKVENPVVQEKNNEGKEKASSNSNGRGEKGGKSPVKDSSNAPSKISTHEAKETDTKEKVNSIEPSSPKKKESSTQDNQAQDVAADGEWSTVENKSRGRRAKGGGGKKLSSGAQNNNNKASNNNNNNHGNNNNNSHGRNHNNDHGSNHHDGGKKHSRRDRRRNKHERERNRHNNHNGSNNNNQQNNSNQGNNNQQNKMVKDVISHILDAVDVEVVQRLGGGESGSKQRNRSNSNASNNKQQNNEQRRKQSKGYPTGLTPSTSMVSNSSAKSLRDVLVGATAQTGNTSQQQTVSKGGSDPSNASSKIKPGMSYKSVIEPAATNEQPRQTQSQSQLPKPKLNAWAKPPSDIKAKLDVEKKNNPQPTGKSSGKIPSSTIPVQSGNNNGLVPHSGSTENKEKNNAPGGTDTTGDGCRTLSSVADDDGTSPPPLSTLLGPGNSHSASSSVASSLEAPHSSANRFRHQSSSATSEDDVGYHLLNVCGQLSDEITTFMSRRALALDIRRKERSAVLNALGETLGKIWPSQCRVEMYGSCATQLDLPSSDLDLVVCGLDDVVVDHIHPSPTPMIDQQSTMGMSSSLHNTSSNSIPEQAQLPEEFIPMSPANQQQQYIQPPSTPVAVGDGQRQQILPAASFADSSVQEGGESSAPLTADGSFAEVETGTMVNESADGGMVGMEYSSTAEQYNDSSHQGEMDGTFSPGYSYHSQQDVAAENYLSPVYSQGGESMGGMEVYQEYQNGQEYYYTSPYSYVSTLSLNAQRVLRLASELELQPWAVQVKAIPTATVPVVKMLADPSKLPGLSGSTAGGNWMMQKHISGVAGGEIPPPPLSPPDLEQSQKAGGAGVSASSSQHFFSPHPMTPQWRGADIMNGLQPVDITFEGPEHGGIGSTTYSARVVQDACDETGLAPESTPVVQVASVLKELLAQRRLNEPFSGGLSSYGLLLLLLAVLKDRKIIQEELKKIERQRQKVSGETNSRPSQKQRESSNGSGVKSTATTAALSSVASPGVESSDKSSTTPSSNSKPTVSSSWASIAKKSNGSTARTDSLSTVTKSTSGSLTAPTAKTGSANYSQVVQKERKDNATKKSSGQQQSYNDQAAKPINGDSAKAQSLEALSEKKQILPQSSNVAIDGPSAVLSQVTPSSEDDAGKLLGSPSSSVPQGSNDVLEVLCSGELTAGKLLMHFLLFYGQHFDARSTLIDINATHHPEYGVLDIDRLSPFVPRPPGGTIDPVTGMFSVDPIVVYDPLEGANDHNVSKRCYCWNNVKWVFAQSYMTVSSIVETSDTTTCNKSSSTQSKKHNRDDANGIRSKASRVEDGKLPDKSKVGSSTDDGLTGILELLLSF